MPRNYPIWTINDSDARVPRLDWPKPYYPQPGSGYGVCPGMERDAPNPPVKGVLSHRSMWGPQVRRSTAPAPASSTPAPAPAAEDSRDV